MEFITEPQVQCEPLRDLEIVRRKEVIAPAQPIDQRCRACASHGRWKSQKKIRIRLTGVPVRKTQASIERIVLLQVRGVVSPDLKAAFDRMSAAIVVDVFLPLLHEVLESRI